MYLYQYYASLYAQDATNQQFTKISGSSLCFSTAYFSAKYAPVTDGGASVYVN